MGVPLLWHVAAVAVVLVALQATAWRRADRRESGDAGRGDGEARQPRVPNVPRHRLALVAPLAVAAVAASYVESPGQEWSALLLGRGLDASPAVAALGPVAFSSGLVVSRLFLDPILTRHAAHRVAAVSAVAVVVSMALAFVATQASASPWPVLVSFAAAGLGVGPIFPLLFGAADQLSVRHGVAPAVTASFISACSRVGAISAPLVVGLAADAVGLPVVLVIMGLGAALILPTLPRALGASSRT